MLAAPLNPQHDVGSRHMPVSRKPQVDQDLLGIADYISRDSLAAAIRFLDAAEATFNWLAESPEVGIRCDFDNLELFDIRWWKVKGFD